MILEGRKLQDIEVRHMAVARGPADDCVAWWYGAVQRNNRDRTLPLVVVWFRKLLPNGAFGPPFRVDVGITELALVQVGTIWNRGVCRSQLALEEREIEVDFSKPGWRYESQLRVHDRSSAELISSAAYPLPFGNRDRSEVLVLSLRRGGELVVPTLEFFSRCYGRSAEVNRILSTYPWSDAEPRLHVPHSHPVPPGYWSVGLPMRIINDDAMFVAHVKYDAYAKAAAKSVYSNLQSQFTSLGGKAFPKIGPWFTGPATLIVQGIPLSNDRFLGLRVEGASEPQGQPILSFRPENPGEADDPADDDAALSGWTGGRDRHTSEIRPLVNVTPIHPPGHAGDVVEVISPRFRIVGQRREVIPQRLSNATTRPGPPKPNERSEQHSPGERQGSGGKTGVASIHTETQLESRGAARDVWDALLHLHDKLPGIVTAVGWYSAQADAIEFIDREPCTVALLNPDEEDERELTADVQKWLYVEQARIRGVLVAYAQTSGGLAYLFEIERRNGQRTADDGSTYDKEQASSGLVVSPPPGMHPSEWIPRVLKGIRAAKGIMARAIAYCPEGAADYYRRSSSKGDEVAGHSTVIKALSKVGIKVPHPKDNVEPRKQKAEREA